MNFSTDVRPAEALANPKYRADIDGLRAVAVRSVVGFQAFPGLIAALGEPFQLAQSAQ